MTDVQFTAVTASRIESRRSHRITCLEFGIVLLVLCLTLWPSQLTAQIEDVDQAAWKRGYNGFALLCRSLNLRIENDLRSWRSIPPDRSILIVLGSTRGLPMDVSDYVEHGGAALVASDQPDYRSFASWGVGFNRGPQRAVRDEDMFRSRSDCPLISNLDRNHPATSVCVSLATNRPGFLALSPDSEASRRYRRETIGRLPRLVASRGRQRNAQPFIASLEPNLDARMLFVADQSIFSNQMMTCEDNAKFALTAMEWLRNGKRDTVLIVSAREIIDPMNPDQLHVILPAPDPADVIAALEQLPPEALIAFGDSVVTAVEDEGVLDELISYVADEIPPRLYARILILIPTIVAIAYLLLRLFNRRYEREGKGGSSHSRRVRSMLERRQAAKLLLTRFRAKVTGSAATPWNDLVAEIRIRGDRLATKILRREVKAVIRRVQSRSSGYWSKRRLQRLHQQVVRWRQLHEQGVLEYDSSLGSQ
jgi:hypothetical protein